MIQILLWARADFHRVSPHCLLRAIVVFFCMAAFGLSTPTLHCHSASAEQAMRPNIVFILADDLGYGDLGCYGHPVANTPVLDSLADQGVRFTQHYSNGQECSPTRTALLTGRYQQRVGGLECAIGTGNVGRYDDAIRLAEQHDLGLPVEEAVLPGELKKSAYRCGLFGKWHLGYEPKFNPMRYGWDEFFGYLGGNVHYFNHRETSDLHVLFQGQEPVDRAGYMTHLITDATIDFIKTSRSDPFFVYVSHECPHFPYQGPEDEDKIVTDENWMQLDPDAYVAMLEDLDREVGRILETLEEAGVAKNTIVIFESDNGGFAGAGNMGRLRGSKGTTLEGGIRVPLIIRWPDRIAPHTISDQVCTTFDLTTSILAVSGAKVADLRLDGMDIISHVAQRRDDIPRTLFWRGRRGEKTWTSVRDGDLKWVQKRESGDTEEWLYDLAGDVGEANDLSASRPGEAGRLRKLVGDWEKEVKPAR
ncbi:MAG: sulfatase-like hydrolase/transferase [Planctomycetales bacterium]|nr:sulfatase-like hydrolase/transferase [Planctomycetales bacterium]